MAAGKCCKSPMLSVDMFPTTGISVDMFPHTDGILDMFPHTVDIHTAVSGHTECIVKLSRLKGVRADYGAPAGSLS